MNVKEMGCRLQWDLSVISRLSAVRRRNSLVLLTTGAERAESNKSLVMPDPKFCLMTLSFA